MTYERVGDLYRALGQGDKAREALLRALQIRERIAKAEPDRAYYQRELSVSYDKVGDLYRALGQGEKARDAFLKALAIAERLANAEPDRADFQVDLAISLVKVGGTMDADGIPHLHRALALLRELDSQGRLAPADQPTIAAIEAILAQ